MRNEKAGQGEGESPAPCFFTLQGIFPKFPVKGRGTGGCVPLMREGPGNPKSACRTLGSNEEGDRKMKWFRRFYLDKEKDIIVDLFRDGDTMPFVLSTPNHGTGNLIRNLARLCELPLSEGGDGLLVIKGTVPSYIDGYNRLVYIFRLGDTKVANIFPDGSVELKAHIPAIAKTLMSQTKDYRFDIRRTIVKTYILSEQKFRTDLHTHMNANLPPDVLIALGICHQIRYPLYYIKKLGLKISREQEARLQMLRKASAARFEDSGLKGKYLTRRIDDYTFINFADLILGNLENAAFNLPRIRRSLSIMKDGQAVFTNLEKVYLYRYVFTKGTAHECPVPVTGEQISAIPDEEIRSAALKMLEDRGSAYYRDNTLFQDKLLWVARNYARQGICYAEISDTTLVKASQAQEMLAQVHAVMPAVTRETGVVLRFLAAIRRIPLTIIRDQVVTGDYFRENLRTLREIAADPYVAGSDIVGEELNDIRDLMPVIREIVRIASEEPSFVIRIHAGENDSLRDNVAGSLRCVRDALLPGQQMPRLRIGHGLYTADLKRAAGRQLIRDLKSSGAVLEFQITSNVRLNNLSDMKNHPLREYLANGIPCVQGTDGGALYGTDSIDEQLSLEKMLGMNGDQMLQMRHSEDAVLAGSLQDFERKKELWKQKKGLKVIAEPDQRVSLTGNRNLPASEVLSAQICELPQDLLPVVIAGGSFNTDNRHTRMRPAEKQLIDRLLEEADPEKIFFVTGHKLSAYEQYLVSKNAGRFRIFAMVPAMLTQAEYKKLAKSGLRIRVSIESAPMGIYKSLAYEIFKRRESILIAFDGNGPAANLIQEAKNSRYPCRIYVDRRSKGLRAKAGMLEGYVRMFDGTDDMRLL